MSLKDFIDIKNCILRYIYENGGTQDNLKLLLKEGLKAKGLNENDIEWRLRMIDDVIAGNFNVENKEQLKLYKKKTRDTY